MKRVKITCYIEPSDPTHSTGLTGEDFDQISSELMSMGAEEYEIELVEEDGSPARVNRPKKAKRNQ